MADLHAQRERIDRLQIRVSIDRHMADLYSWLLALPPTVRGRELVAQARVARALLTTAARVPSPAESTVLPATMAGCDMSALQLSAGLSDQAVAQARSRLELGFFTAVPPQA